VVATGVVSGVLVGLLVVVVVVGGPMAIAGTSFLVVVVATL
jgi:hypothetical protein